VRVDKGIVPGTGLLVADLENVDEDDLAVVLRQVLDCAGDFRNVGALECSLGRGLGVVK
jgi:hypothetical protein